MKRIISLLIITIIAMNLSAQNKKAIVAYYSATGTTEALAEQLAADCGAELYEIEPAEKYTAADLDWTNKKSRSSVEMNDKSSRPALKSGKSLAEYDVIYIGYPIWWAVAPRVVNTFIEQADLEGKTVILFATSGGSGIEPSVVAMKTAYPKVNWQQGILKR